MHNIFRKILKSILGVLARTVISRYQPVVIGITGSVGKTTAKEAIYTVLERKFRVRKNEFNFNNELGVPMTVLGINPKTKNKLYLLWEVLQSVWLAYGLKNDLYPKVLVLELAADRPGDIKYLTDTVRPSIGVVTAVGEIPVHVEFYSSPKAVAREKATLIESIPANGLAVLNYDDQIVLDMKEKAKSKTKTIGFSEMADIWVSGVSYIISEEEILRGGLAFKVHHGGHFVPFRVPSIIGLQQIYAVLAAVAVGHHLGINLVDIAASMEHFKPPQDRSGLVSGIKNSLIINDVYNASPTSTHAALDTLRDFGGNVIKMQCKGKKIAVLGDMKELGKYAEQAHRDIGVIVSRSADILITVGTHARFMAEAASSIMSSEKILSFENSEEAKIKVQEMIEEGDVILIKGSRSMKMEVILDEILSH